MELMSTEELISYPEIRSLKILFDICTLKNGFADYIIIAYIHFILCH